MPGAMLPPQLLSDAVEMACRAPSLHNSQPWRWVAEGTSTLNLYAEPGRALTTLDPLGREIYLSCGAALDHLVVPLAAAGWSPMCSGFLIPPPRCTWPKSTSVRSPVIYRYKRASGLKPSWPVTPTCAPSKLRPTGRDSK